MRRATVIKPITTAATGAGFKVLVDNGQTISSRGHKIDGKQTKALDIRSDAFGGKDFYTMPLGTLEADKALQTNNSTSIRSTGALCTCWRMVAVDN